jgi:hypothetical protein
MDFLKMESHFLFFLSSHIRTVRTEKTENSQGGPKGKMT